MMLPLLGLATIVVLLGAILSKRMSPLVALILVPIAAALLGGFGLQTSGFVIDGLKSLAPVVGMFVFAILYFGTITDAGTLDPIIDRILRAVGTRPTRIVMGTTLLALLIHLDGSGAVCFLVTIPAMLPLYDRLGMDRRVLAAAVSMAAGINFLPWTGPMIRASASLHLPVSALFNPLIPVQAVGLAFVFGAAWWLGRREQRRLGAGLAGGGVDPDARARADGRRAGAAPPAPVLVQPRADARRARHDGRDGREDPARDHVHGRAVHRADGELPRRRHAAPAHRRACARRADDGRHPAGRRRVHRHHAGQRHAQGDGAGGGRLRAAVDGRPHPGRARPRCRCR